MPTTDAKSKLNAVHTVEEVAQNDGKNGRPAWIIVRDFVYNVTKFAMIHPGGRGVVLRFAGTDCTEEFDQHHNDLVMKKYHRRLCIGKVAREPKKPGRLAKMARAMGAGMDLPNLFGDLVPFSDPQWYQGWASPYYNESHRKFRAAVRQLVNEEVIPNVHKWDEAKKLPKSFLQKCAQTGTLPIVVGNPWPTDYVAFPPPYGVDPDEMDYFHELIFIDELSRCGSGGVLWGISGGLSIGLPPVLHFGSEELKQKVVVPCLAGDKTCCLAITEPWGGSDVANLTTTARLSDCGEYYIVNGEKKWITNGVSADFFTTAVRTGGPGMGGVSLLLIERTEGVTTKQMNCMGVWASGTTYITFEDVKVPVGNLIGKENKGFRYIMHNFNHERWSIVCQANRFARCCLEEAVKFATRRKAFGKRLIDQPVIRAKVAEMARMVMATHAALEDLTYQFQTMPKLLQPYALGGQTALLKVQATMTFEFCAREAAQILGGCSYTRGGQGDKVERLYREVRAFAIPGGSEEIMRDLGVRQALKIAELVRKIRPYLNQEEPTASYARM